MMEERGRLAWSADMQKLAGKRHRERGMMCQDNTACLKLNGKQAAALVDGIGRTDANARFGQAVADMVTAFLLENLERIRKADDREVAYNLMVRVERLMAQKEKEYGTDRQELASTLLGAVADSRDNYFCCIHLGDGVIAVQTDQGRIRILSGPANGRNSNETVLTTSECALRELSVRCGYLKGIKGVLLASDGIYNSWLDHEKLKKCFSGEDIRNVLAEEIDDQAFVRMNCRMAMA